MLELELLKKSYFQGRLIWIHGPKGTRKIRMTYEFLGSCQVDEHEIAIVNAREFPNYMNETISDSLLKGVRVFVLTDLDDLSCNEMQKLSQYLIRSRRLFFSCGIRVVLVSVGDLSFEEKTLHHLRVTQVNVSGCRFENLDERVHWALEQACKVSQKRVIRLSECAAKFLEFSSEEFQDDGLLNTLVCAVHNSSEGILRLDDFFKSVIRREGPPEEYATC
ncbi:MAG: hypothetical protein JST80_12595 [Bdellovibrionales bacterium]|nr:hypothetical protein [Bdellovibrionales bacterium]